MEPALRGVSAYSHWVSPSPLPQHSLIHPLSLSGCAQAAPGTLDARLQSTLRWRPELWAQGELGHTDPRSLQTHPFPDLQNGPNEWLRLIGQIFT